MSQFGGLRKHEKTQHALVRLGSAPLAADVAITQVRRPEFPERDNKVYKKERKTKTSKCKFEPGTFASI